jgi:hypothetical protein
LLTSTALLGSISRTGRGDDRYDGLLSRPQSRVPLVSWWE